MNQLNPNALRSSLKSLALRQLTPHALNAAMPVLVPSAFLGASIGVIAVIGSDASLFLLPACALIGGLVGFSARFALAMMRGRRASASLSLLKEADRGAHAEDLLLTVWQAGESAFASALQREAMHAAERAKRSPRARLHTQRLLAFASVLVVALAIAIAPHVMPDAPDASSNDQASADLPDDAPASGDEAKLPGMFDGEEKGESESSLVESSDAKEEAAASSTGSDAGASGDGAGEGANENKPGEAQNGNAGRSVEGDQRGTQDSKAGADENKDSGATGEAPASDPELHPEKNDYVNRPPRRNTGAQQQPADEPEKKDQRDRVEDIKAFDPWANPAGDRRKLKTQRDVYDPNAQGDELGPDEKPAGVPEKAEASERKLGSNATLTERERAWAKEWAEKEK